MQTFLPYPDFQKSAKSLDYRRLGKQRVETLQLLTAIERVSNGEAKVPWSNHPCCKMWSNNSNALVEYGIAICEEWLSRGYKDGCLEKIRKFQKSSQTKAIPSFIGNFDFHLSHRSNLVRKKPEFYLPLWPSTPDNIPYIWPCQTESN
jgi:hypothetical protein